MRLAIFCGVIVVIGGLLATAVQAQTTVTLSDSAITQNTSISDNSTGNGFGGYSGLYVGDGGSNAKLPDRSLIEFNLAAANIPAGATITSTKLTLFLGLYGGGGSNGTGPATQPSTNIDLFKVTPQQNPQQNWTEGTSLAGPGTSTLGQNGGGNTAASGDATWIDSTSASVTPSFSEVKWATAGGDFAGTASASAAVTAVTTIAGGADAYTWGSTTGMVADVQSWLNTPSTNFGWLLKNEIENFNTTGGNANLRAFYSSHAVDTSGDSPAVDLTPELTITYVVPEPSSFALAGLAFSVLAARRRR
jgi:hypothetical protein